MCYNFTVSLWSGIAIFSIALYLYQRNQLYDRYLAIFLMAGGSMQFLEAYIWRNLKDPYNPTYIYILLALQLPILLATSYYYAPKDSFLRQPIWIGLFTILVFLFTLHYLRLIMQSKKASVQIGPNGHMSWHIWPYAFHPMELIYYLIIFCFFAPYLHSKRILLIMIATFGFLMYAMIRYGVTMEWGSMWCWMVLFLAILALIF